MKEQTKDLLQDAFATGMEALGIDCTVSVGAVGQASYVVGGTGSVQLVIDSSGNAQYQWSRGETSSIGTNASVCGFVTITNAPDVTDCLGWSTQMGGSSVNGLSIGGEGTLFNSGGELYGGGTATIGLGAPGAQWTATEWTYTEALSDPFNLFDLVPDWIYELSLTIGGY